MLVIHNSETKRKETLVPLRPGKITMYVCGMTVYDYCHIGHARVLVSFDVMEGQTLLSGAAVGTIDPSDLQLQRDQAFVHSLMHRVIEPARRSDHRECANHQRLTGLQVGDDARRPIYLDAQQRERRDQD